MMRNRRRERENESDGLSESERLRRGKELGEQDYTDFENPYVRLSFYSSRWFNINVSVVSVHPMINESITS